MSEFLVDPGDEGLRLWVTSDENGRAGTSPGMNVPGGMGNELLAALRDLAAKRVDYCLNVALLKWQESARNIPGLIDRATADSVLAMVDRTQEALRVLAEVAVELVEDEESGDD